MRTITNPPKYLAHTMVFLLIALMLAACGGPVSGVGSNQRVNLQIMDAGGFMAQAKPMIVAYRKAHPQTVGTVTYLPRVQAPDLPGRIRAEQGANRVVTSLILSGYDGVASSVKQGIVESLTPTHSDKFPNLDENYLPAAKQYTDLAGGYALVFSYTPSGPVFEYDPAQVPNPPTTIEGLRSWIKANPHKFLYARPANSGPGRTMLMALPYLLGDKNPKDPINGWTNTWAFLKDIGSSIDSYPTRTGDTMTDLGKGSVAMIASTLGWDINPRYLHQVPSGDKTFVLQNTTFVADAAFVMMPKGMDKPHQNVVLDLMAWMLTPKQQAYNYDSGYFYPGPAVQNVPVSLAPPLSQQILQQYGRPEYDTTISQAKIVMPLDADQIIAAFSKWDRDIGGSKYKSS